MAARCKTELTVPRLPENKSYHALFLYRSESPDKDLIKDVINRLENCKYKCCFHERDFIPGKGITRNFEDVLEQSVKYVFLISEASTQSDWCEYELNWVLRKGASRLIPLKYQTCKIPERLKHLTYLEVDECIDDWLSRLVSAINFEFETIAEGRGCTSWSRIKKVVKFVAVPCIFYNVGRCKNTKCRYPHLCKKFVVNNACTESCSLSHDVYNDQSKEILGELGFEIDDELLMTYRTACSEKLSTFHEKQVLGPCLYYNTPEVGCADGDSCKFTHICIKWFNGDCTEPKGKCRLSHDILNFQTKGMMEFYELDTNQSVDDILFKYREKYPLKNFIYPKPATTVNKVMYGAGVSFVTIAVVYAVVRRFRT